MRGYGIGLQDAPQWWVSSNYSSDPSASRHSCPVVGHAPIDAKPGAIVVQQRTLHCTDLHYVLIITVAGVLRGHYFIIVVKGNHARN